MGLGLMLNSKDDAEYLVGVVGGMISGVILVVLKIFMMYNLWQDIFVVNNVVATFKSIVLYILFGCANILPISLAIFKHIGVNFNFTISATTIWLAIACIVAEAFFDSFYKLYKNNK